MKKERKPVAVVEEAPYEGPTIFDKVPPSQDKISHLHSQLRFSRRRRGTGAQWRGRMLRGRETGKD